MNTYTGSEAAMFMRKTIAVCALFTLPTVALAQDAELAKALEKYWTSSGFDEVAFQRELAKARQAKQAQARLQPTASSLKLGDVPSTPDASEGDAAAKNKAQNVFIRQNFSDVHLFDRPTDASKAKGAEFSWSKDGVTGDRTWGVHGMAAFGFTVPGTYATTPGSVAVLGTSFGAYAQVDRDTHSVLVKKNADTVVAGGYFEIGLDTKDVSHYFRFRAGTTNDNIKDTNYLHSAAEWIPVTAFGNPWCKGFVIGFPCPILPGWQYQLNPEIKVQYDQALDGTAPVFFSQGDRSLRVGPEVTLLLFSNIEPKPILGGFLDAKNLSSKLTYHWDTETYSGQRYRWLDTSITYNIGESGNLGLTGSYQRGNTEEVGQATNLYKLTLTGKY